MAERSDSWTGKTGGLNSNKKRLETTSCVPLPAAQTSERCIQSEQFAHA